jgi:hypothetical protein
MVHLAVDVQLPEPTRPLQLVGHLGRPGGRGRADLADRAPQGGGEGGRFHVDEPRSPLGGQQADS